MAEVRVQTERVDDVPLLIHQQRRMGIPQTLNEVITPHGNWQGLSMGWLAATWLAYILSSADHRMCEVEPWAEDHLEMLKAVLPEAVQVKDFTDDRLADLLGWLSDDTVWEAIETQLGQHLVRVYDLEQDPVRLDSTTAAVYHDTEGTTLFRYGYSKDRRPDLAQFKVVLGTLDPLGMPLATLVVAGNEADDGLYVPTIGRTRQVVGQGGRLYLGDAKMAALATRAFIQAGRDYYLNPLPQTGKVPDLLRALLEPVWRREQPLQSMHRPADDASTEPSLVALGYETIRSQEAIVDGQRVRWDERLLVIYSPTLAQQQRRGLTQRLERAAQELCALTPPRGRGRRQWAERAPLQRRVQSILNRRGVEGLLEVVTERQVEGRSIRQYGDRPARTEERVRYEVHVQRQLAMIQATRRLMGWRLYVTNAPGQELSLADAVNAYRGGPRIERNFRRLKGRPLGICPLYVRREDHAKGIVRVLSLGLRVLTLVEHIARRTLKVTGEALAGLYAGNPKRETVHLTTERLLKAFEGLTLSVIELPGQTIHHITPLSDLQRRILGLLSLPVSIYETLAASDGAIPP